MAIQGHFAVPACCCVRFTSSALFEDEKINVAIFRHVACRGGAEQDYQFGLGDGYNPLNDLVDEVFADPHNQNSRSLAHDPP